MAFHDLNTSFEPMKVTDSILMLALPMLPFDEAFRATCTLSKAWANLWTVMRCFILTDRLIVDPEETEPNQEFQKRAFLELARTAFGQLPLIQNEKFALVLSYPTKFEHQLDAILGYALSLNIKWLLINFSDPSWDSEDDSIVLNRTRPRFDLPSSVYKHPHFVLLKFYSVRVRMEEFENLSDMEEIVLVRTRTRKKDIVTLLGKCPKLESLCLKKCWNDDDHLCIESGDIPLHSIVLDKCDFGFSPYFQFDVRHLQYFTYIGHVAWFEFGAIGLPVKETSLDFTSHPKLDVEAGNFVHQLLYDFTSSRVLTVCRYLLQVFPWSQEEEMLFTSNPLEAHHLILKTALHDRELLGIHHMLRCCAHIKTLTIEMFDPLMLPGYLASSILNDPSSFWETRVLLPRCFKSRLRTIEIYGFKYDVNLLNMLRYLLQYCKRLRRVDLCISDDVDDEERDEAIESAEMVQGFVRSSRSVVISIF